MPPASLKNDSDLIALGAGPAGESATELAAAFGKRGLVVERHKAGGTVTTTGDAPMNTATDSYADKDAAFDGLKRLRAKNGQIHA